MAPAAGEGVLYSHFKIASRGIAESHLPAFRLNKSLATTLHEDINATSWIKHQGHRPLSESTGCGDVCTVTPGVSGVDDCSNSELKSIGHRQRRSSGASDHISLFSARRRSRVSAEPPKTSDSAYKGHEVVENASIPLGAVVAGHDNCWSQTSLPTVAACAPGSSSHSQVLIVMPRPNTESAVRNDDHGDSVSPDGNGNGNSEATDPGNRQQPQGGGQQQQQQQQSTGSTSASTAATTAESTSARAWESEVQRILSSSTGSRSGGGGKERYQVALRPGPPPAAELVRCCIRRVKPLFGSGCSFQMYLEEGNTFLLAARKRKKSKTSSYVISQDPQDIRRGTENCLAKLKANFVGTEYMLWGRSGDRHSARKGFASEDLCINFRQTALSSSGSPRNMCCAMPSPGSSGSTGAGGSRGLGLGLGLDRLLELAKNHEVPSGLESRLSLLHTKAPEWCKEMKTFTLDFGERVKEASVKNFQLVCWEHNSNRMGPQVIMQFGKAEEDLFVLDLAYPMCIMTAFAIALASIDTKLCYTI